MADKKSDRGGQAEAPAPSAQTETAAPAVQAETAAPVAQAETAAPVAQAETAAPVAQAKTAAPLTRRFKVACNVQHDGILYTPDGDQISCTKALFDELVAAGAIKPPTRDDD